MKVLIVGAGPTGLTAAVELARRGISADLIERRAGPSQLSRAVGILPSSMDILVPSGVAAEIDAQSVHPAGVIFHDGAAPLARITLPAQGRARIWALAQDRTEAILAAALERHGGSLRYGERFLGLEQHAGGVQVRTSRGEAVYDYVVGADGVRSAVRGALGLPFEGIDLPGEWSIADVESDAWPDWNWFKGFLLPQGQVAVVLPLSPGRFRVVCSLPDALAALPVAMPVRRLIRADRFTIAVRQVPRYALGRVYLAGDAAHCHSPVGGRGLNLGVADAADLAARLAGERGGLEGYHAARHREGRRVIAFSERGRKVVQSRSVPVRMLRNGMIRLAGSIPWLGRAMLRDALDA
ncbi:MAG: FAD-dependent oxidoreductase [Pararhodobacter sp.]